MENLGTAVVPGVPWVGGSNIVIWREAQVRLERERAAVLLANFLASQSTQIKYAAVSDSIPARSNALPHLKFEPVSLSQTFEQALRTGRSCKPTLIWVRLLNDLSRTFDMITADILADPPLDVAHALSERLDPLARRFDLMLLG